MTGWSKLLLTTTTTSSSFHPSLPTFRNLLLTSSLRNLTALPSSVRYTNKTTDQDEQVSDLLADIIPHFVANPIRHLSENDHPHSRITDQMCLGFLSACRSRCLKEEGTFVHSPIVKLGLHGDVSLCNRLLSVYSRCYGVNLARKLFDELLHRDVVTWTTMMSAYVKEGNSEEEAVRLFQGMMLSGFVPNEFTLSTILRSCSSLGELQFGKCVHAWILKFGLESNPVLGSALMHLYSRCGLLDEALDVFGMMSCSDTVLWTTMISAFVQANDWHRAWELYSKMAASGVSPSEFTFSNLLVACGSLGVHYGNLVHAHMILWGAKLNIVLKTTLVDMYSKCLQMEDAMKVFNQTPESDVMLWTTIISGYNQVLSSKEAILTFQKMDSVGISPNAFTYAGILSTCTAIPAAGLGKQIHSRVVKAGLEDDVSVGNALMDMYTKCSSYLDQPLLLFKGFTTPNVVSWTILITALSQHQQHGEAFLAFTEMRAGGLQPNPYTISSILKSCEFVESLTSVRKLHAYILKTKFGLMEERTVGNSLVDAYSRLGDFYEAHKVFESMPVKDVITYTSLVKGMNQMGLHGMALDMITHMREDNVEMDGFSLPCFLSASAGLASIEAGKQLQCHSIKSGLDSQISVLNGLIDMYGKCGSASEARLVFMTITEPNVVSWNGLILGLASSGHFSDALSAFEDMRMAGIQPDKITFLLVLYTCSHAGLADLGLEYFNSMMELYSIPPQLDHYVCLVDILGRAGRLEEAASKIDTMPFPPDVLIYKTLLGSCKVHRNLVLGESVARNALALDPMDPAVYVLLSNMYDDAGRSDHAKQIRRMMRERGIVKCPGQSWIEIQCKFYLFKAGDTSNPCISNIHRKLEFLEARMRNMGWSAANVGSLHHSEKLALAFGLLNALPAAPIRIIKNLRTCEDCHAFMELSSRIIEREIIIRDGSRFHLFKNELTPLVSEEVRLCWLPHMGKFPFSSIAVRKILSLVCLTSMTMIETTENLIDLLLQKVFGEKYFGSCTVGIKGSIIQFLYDLLLTQHTYSSLFMSLVFYKCCFAHPINKNSFFAIYLFIILA